jgi:4-amino-4-deoxy-L-arabinose transferase-like glycosyltransferase
MGPSGCFFLVCVAPALSWYVIVPVEAAAKAKNEIFRFFFF